MTPDGPLSGVRVVAALVGLELYGQQRANLEVFKALSRQGATIRVAVNEDEDGGAVGAAVRDLGFKTVPLPFGNQWSWQWLRKYPRSVWEKLGSVAVCSRRLHHAVRELHATHVYLTSSLAFSYVWPALAVSMVPTVYRIGETPPTDSPFNLFIWRAAAHRCSRLIVNSEFLEHRVVAEGAPRERVRLIRNVASTPAEAPTSDSRERNHGGQRRLLYVGQLAEQKGVRIVVQAFGILAPRFPDLALVIVGGSRYQRDFQREIEGLILEGDISARVELPGYVGDPLPYYRDADVHVAPSLWDEGSPGVVLEAKREGLPSVVFRSGGLPEMINNGEDGVICEEKTPEALAAGIAWLLEDRERCAAAGRAAREDYHRRFGPERFARQWAAVFADGMGREVRGPTTIQGRLR